MPVCGGCGAILASEGGYQRHLTMTTNHACREYFRRQLMDMDFDDDQDEMGDNPWYDVHHIYKSISDSTFVAARQMNGRSKTCQTMHHRQ